MSARDVIGVLGSVMFVGCGLLIVIEWRNPRSGFLLGLIQTRTRRRPGSTDPARDAAAICWAILGFTVASPGLLYSAVTTGSSLRRAPAEGVVGYVCVGAFLACLVLAAWVCFGNAPQRLRPAAMREEPD
ncbi:MAG: hypothetical protein WKF79_07270 [Nocardioides sp.]